MGPRVGLSSILILGALVLLIAIAVGQNMGNRVLGQIANRSLPVLATPVPTPTASADDLSGRANAALSVRHEAISVATDPGFPDPRVTPEPPPPPPPPPTARPTRRPTPGPSDDGDSGDSAPAYTSPPMPIPLVTHPPTDSSPPDEGGESPSPGPTGTGRTGALSTPHPGFSGRGFPTLPPYAGATGTP